MREKDIIRGLTEDVSVTKEELIALLNTEDEAVLEELLAAACEVRERHFGNKVFLYGFIYFSTYCRNNCSFCLYHRTDDEGSRYLRYRSNCGEILEIAKKLAESGVHLIELSFGDDPELQKESFGSVLDLVDDIHDAAECPVMISPGVLSDELIEAFAKRNTEFYALYQETYNRTLFEKLRLYPDFDERIHAKRKAKECGMLIEEGVRIGFGETAEDIADALLSMAKLGVSQYRVLTFVPPEGISEVESKSHHRQMEKKIIALMRLMNPKALIPVSFDVADTNGLENCIQAGCNAVASIVSCDAGFVDSDQNNIGVKSGFYTVAEVVPQLDALGMCAAEAKDFKDWLKKTK